MIMGKKAKWLERDHSSIIKKMAKVFPEKSNQEKKMAKNMMKIMKSKTRTKNKKYLISHINTRRIFNSVMWLKLRWYKPHRRHQVNLNNPSKLKYPSGHKDYHLRRWIKFRSWGGRRWTKQWTVLKTVYFA